MTIPPSSSELPGEVLTDRRRRRFVANRAFGAIKATHASQRTLMESVADALMDIASSTPFFALHVIWFMVWIPWNMGYLGLRPFDPFPFGLLTMVVSLEAIFLSVFVLMAQKRESAIAELREELALQVNLRIEEEITKSLQLVAGLYTRLGHRVAEDPELSDMMQPLDIAAIEHALAEQIEAAAAHRRSFLRPRAAPEVRPGSDSVGSDSVGSDPVESVGSDSLGSDPLGSDPLRSDPMGSESTGTESGPSLPR